MNRIPTKEQVAYIRQQYPAGTRITLRSMDDPQAPLPGTKGTVSYVDDMGQIGVKWDTGSSLSLIPGEDSFSKEPALEKTKHKRSRDLER
ncbi:Uncharacterised protein [uncultured Ruminococcus sp.]|uniref:DUF4314 domain-containing protein n=1 Tax=Hydrogeniiclostridium mannosilyticum TaxID=2764322 RepID=A0A328UJJ0_9FIRM|nr:DUF4314 domain-containing protein [Hydrogeniiclostridium mannosilyticum]RAQ30154.1 DUF4314 domain-containing protein [Hydrogeniiclostridium mannosilyticum]SCH10710.1 Uncharacterised protein [uncultured Ruminococcus sp.]